jgi:hypothetical protein
LEEQQARNLINFSGYLLFLFNRSRARAMPLLIFSRQAAKETFWRYYDRQGGQLPFMDSEIVLSAYLY